jgi:ABC-type lipoprotein release transport system permease subunit
MLIGLLGALFGYGLGLGVAHLWGTMRLLASSSQSEWVVPQSEWVMDHWFSPKLLLATILIATLLSGLASWIPALLAAGKDPACVLREG